MNEQAAILKLRQIIRRKHLALSTEESYVAWVRRYIGFLKKDRHGGTSEQKMSRFLTFIAQDGGGIAASTQNQAFNALLFFYRHVMGQQLNQVHALRAKKPIHVRTAPDRATTMEVLNRVQDRNGYSTRLVAWMLYGMGLRVGEPLKIRIKDLSFHDSVVVLRGAKGGKDRVRSIPCALVEPLKSQILIARGIFEQAQKQNIPVKMPNGLSRKYPSGQHQWGWFWLFPSKKSCVCKRTNQTVWWHMHEANVQRAVKDAAEQIGMGGAITPHVFRHAWATHAMQDGSSVKAVQEALGHKSLETTQVYLHDSTQVTSPLDRPIQGQINASAKPLHIG